MLPSVCPLRPQPPAIFSYHHPLTTFHITSISLTPCVISLSTPASSFTTPWCPLTPSLCPSSCLLSEFDYFSTSFTKVSGPNTVNPPRPQLLHFFSVRNKGEGHARSSWHQPVTPAFLLPPSVSRLNQITSLTHVHTQACFSIILLRCFSSNIFFIYSFKSQTLYSL